MHAIKLYWFTRGLLNLGHRVTGGSCLAALRERSRSLARCRALLGRGTDL